MFKVQNVESSLPRTDGGRNGQLMNQIPGQLTWHYCI